MLGLPRGHIMHIKIYVLARPTASCCVFVSECPWHPTASWLPRLLIGLACDFPQNLPTTVSFISSLCRVWHLVTFRTYLKEESCLQKFLTLECQHNDEHKRTVSDVAYLNILTVLLDHLLSGMEISFPFFLVRVMLFSGHTNGPEMRVGTVCNTCLCHKDTSGSLNQERKNLCYSPLHGEFSILRDGKGLRRHSSAKVS